MSFPLPPPDPLFATYPTHLTGGGPLLIHVTADLLSQLKIPEWSPTLECYVVAGRPVMLEPQPPVPPPRRRFRQLRPKA